VDETSFETRNLGPWILGYRLLAFLAGKVVVAIMYMTWPPYLTSWWGPSRPF
jgi:hypothetical protein